MDRPADTQVVLVLKGPLAGYTGKLRHWYFKDGRHVLTAPPSEQGQIIKYLNRCYQAVPEEQMDYDGNAAPELEVRLVLQGPLAGHTGKLRHWNFVDGECVLRDLPENLEGIIKYLGTCYQAFPANDKKAKPAPVVDEERAALAAALRREARSGERDVQEETVEDSDTEVRSEVPADGAKDSASKARESAPSGEGKAGGAGVQAEGDSRSARLARVISDLDRDNEKHWTKSGDPSVFAVRTLTGDESITKAHLADVWDFDKHEMKE
jgi:hypothetical protein